MTEPWQIKRTWRRNEVEDRRRTTACARESGVSGQSAVQSTSNVINTWFVVLDSLFNCLKDGLQALLTLCIRGPELVRAAVERRSEALRETGRSSRE